MLYEVITIVPDISLMTILGELGLQAAWTVGLFIAVRLYYSVAIRKLRVNGG